MGYLDILVSNRWARAAIALGVYTMGCWAAYNLGKEFGARPVVYKGAHMGKKEVMAELKKNSDAIRKLQRGYDEGDMEAMFESMMTANENNLAYLSLLTDDLELRADIELLAAKTRYRLDEAEKEFGDVDR